MFKRSGWLNYLLFYLGFFLVFGLVGRAYCLTCEEGCSVNFVTWRDPGQVSAGSTSNYAPSGTWSKSSCASFSFTASGTIPNGQAIYYAKAGKRFWSGSTWTASYSDTSEMTVTFSQLQTWIAGANLVIDQTSQGYLGVPAYATLYPTGCPAPPCTSGAGAGWYSVPGRDLSFNYCSNGCSLDNSVVGYFDSGNVTVFHGSQNGQECSGGTSATPYTPQPPPGTPQCPSGQIWSPSASACVPISSGTGSGTLNPSASAPGGGTGGYYDTYNTAPPSDGTGSGGSGYGSVSSGSSSTTIYTTVNPDGSVTEEKTAETLDAPGQPSGDAYLRPPRTLDWSAFNTATSSFAQTGPVQAFRSLSSIIDSLLAEPLAPVFKLPVWNYECTVDLSWFDPLAAMIRWALMAFGLIGTGFFILRQWRAA